jgi:hypothetical protein
VAAICRKLDALPLALELAAPWLKVLAPDDLLQRLERHAVLPGAGARDLPDRQQTMNATVEIPRAPFSCRARRGRSRADRGQSALHGQYDRAPDRRTRDSTARNRAGN